MLAQNIVAYRAANGEFKSRRALLKVPRLGAKAFEQAAGFLRVVGGANPLDNSAVHPESYAVVERMAADAGVTVERLLTDKQLRSGLKAERYVSEEAGLPTVTDILEALDKRGSTHASSCRSSHSTPTCTRSATCARECFCRASSPTSRPSGLSSTSASNRTGWCTSRSWPTATWLRRPTWCIWDSTSKCG